MSLYYIAIVLGTRPEAIKFAVLILKLKEFKNIKLKIILTGQHKESVKEIFDLFGIREDLDFNIMKIKQSLTYITKEVLLKLESEFEYEKPDLVLVQGDTTSAFAAALAAFYKKINVAHIESGLRTNNLYNPYPEEVNRKLISQIASLNFAPTEKCADNLRKENLTGTIEITGNTVVDSLLYVENNFIRKNKIKESSLDEFLLVTVHRRENWGLPLQEIAKGLLLIVKEYKDLNIVVPMHPNKIVREILFKYLKNEKQIKLIEPLNYVELIRAIKNCRFILTDSGGLQEEAPSFGKPVLVLRETTERLEGINYGTAKLIGTNSKTIFNETSRLLKDKNLYKIMSKDLNPYGDGSASDKIILSILKFLDSQ